MRWFAFLTVFLTSFGLADSTGSSIENSTRYAKLRSEINLSTDLLKSKPALEEAIKLYKLDGDIWWQLAQARLRAKEYDPAIEAYQEALKLGAFGNKFRAAAMYDMACAYSLKGDKERGFEWLRKSLDAGFRDLQHVRTDADLDALHSDRRWEEVAATKDVSKMSRDEAWRYDLWLLNREVARIHFNAYSKFTKAETEAWVKKLDHDIPKMSDNEIKVAFMKYMRRLGDGHSSIRMSHAAPPSTLPIQLYWFDEGMYVISADPSQKDLLGAKVVKVAGQPLDQVIAKLDEVISQDNSQDVKSLSPRYLTIPALLNGLGLSTAQDETVLDIVGADGKSRTVTLKAGANPTQEGWVNVRDTSPDASPLYLKNRNKAYWFEPLPGMKAVYMQYNAVRNESDEDTAKFSDRLMDYIDKNDVQRLIVDVRWNGGGNSFLNRPIVNSIIGCKKINQPGHLFIITGRQTFSAAQNFTTDLDRALSPIFVGEPTGSSPNFVGETIRFALPYCKMEGSISDLYWQRSWPMDHRTWIAPDLPASPSFDLFKANRDPAMEVIEAFLKGN